MRKTLLLLLLMVLSFSLVSSASLNMKDSFEPGETMIIAVEGNILEPISLEQIQFKRNNVDVVTEFDVQRIQDTYYIWALAPQTPNNYTLTIKDAYATVLGSPQITDIAKNFTVSGNLTKYSIKPGFISSTRDFKIEVQLNSDTTEIIDVNFPKQQSFIILPGKNIIPFSISSLNKTQMFNLKIGKYQIPTYIQVNKTTSTTANTKSVKFIPRIIQSTQSYPFSYEIQILNSGEKIDNLTLEYDSRLFKLNRNSAQELDEGDVFSFNLSLINNSIPFISGSIVARYDNFSTMLPFEINITSKSNSSSTSYKNTSTALFKCAELPGKVCQPDEICSGTTITSLDGLCCTKTCDKQSSGFNYKIFGYGIALIILVVLVLIAGRYLKAKPNKNQLEQILNKDKQK